MDQNLHDRHISALKLGFDGDFGGSIASLKQLSKENPDDVEIIYDLAMTEMLLGQFEEACDHLKQVLAKDPAHAKALQQVTYC